MMLLNKTTSSNTPLSLSLDLSLHHNLKSPTTLTPSQTSTHPKKKNFKNLALGKASIKSLKPPSIGKLLLDTTTNNNITDYDKELNTAWVKPQRNIYENGPIEMVSNVYLGDESNAFNLETLKKFNIGLIINVANEVENDLLDTSSISYDIIKHNESTFYLRKNGVYFNGEEYSVYSKKFFWDHNHKDLKEYFSLAHNLIDFTKSNGKNVLIHCQCGISRSASLMISYVMKTLRMGFDAAYHHVKVRSDVVSPNLSLISQLLNYEKDLRKSKELKFMSFKQVDYPKMPATPALKKSFF